MCGTDYQSGWRTSRYCSTKCRGASRLGKTYDRECAHCAAPFTCRDKRQIYCGRTCGYAEADARDRANPERRAIRSANSRTQGHRRRTATRTGDVTGEATALLLASRTFCPLCRRKMTDAPRQPTTKHLDHIVPINQGGTHTLGNVRVICATCNLKRPNDGSDYTGPITLWAQSTT